MDTIIIGTSAERVSLLRQCLEERGHHVSCYASVLEVDGRVGQSDPLMIILLDPDHDDLHMMPELRQSSIDRASMCVAVIDPDRVDLMSELVQAGVDETIIESLSDQRRLHARLAFAEEAVRTKSERQKAERRAIRREMQHSVITRLAQTAVEESSPAALFAEASAAIVELVEMDASLLLTRSEQTGRLTPVAFHGWDTTPDIAAGEDEFVKCLEEGKVVSGRNLFVPPSSTLDVTLQSGVWVPMKTDDSRVGMLAAYSTDPDAITEDDVEFLKIIANFLASAIRRKRAEEALRESEVRAKTILDTTVDAIITIDATGTIESFNQAAEKIFGYSADETMGENIKMLMPPPYRREHDEYLENYHRTGKRKIIGIGREVVGQRKDGSTFPMYLAVSEMDVGGERLYTGIVRDITEQRRLEREILRVTEHERHRIGQDLHDGLGQMLTGIGLISQSLTGQLKQEEHPAASMSEEITTLIREADQHARMLSRSLVPVEFDEKGLLHALERLAGHAERLFGITCEADVQVIPDFDDITTEVNLYRIAQEAVSNAVKHGQATKVKIVLVSGEERVRLRIVDDGKGFSEDWQEHRGLGVRIMHFRAKLVRGTLDIHSDDRGSIITCSVPLVGLI